MIKGVNKRVIIIEHTDDPYFEKAVLYIKNGVGERSTKQTLASRAQELLDRISDGEEPKEKLIQTDKTRNNSNKARLKRAAAGAATFAAGAAGTLVIFLVCR